MVLCSSAEVYGDYEQVMRESEHHVARIWPTAHEALFEVHS